MRDLKILILFVLLQVGCQQQMVLKSAIHQEPSKGEEAVYFEFDKWVLGPDQREVLEKQEKFLKRHEGLILILEGHTDVIGEPEYNLQLGDRRARKVKLELVNRGISPSRLVVISHGMSRPKIVGGSLSAHQSNRRVEFHLK